ncbi:MAG: hypothetical protein AAFY37_13910 [Pseudomonadota bacterium]
MTPLFDAYIMVDWSAAAKPATGANSIWIGVLAKDARLNLQFQAVNPDTRLKARAFLEEMIERLTKRGDKVLLGFDFSFGFPAGTADALGLTGDAPPWAAMHAHLAGKVREKPDNSNARFALAAGMNYAMSKGPFPFWGAPARDQVSTLSGKKPDFGPDALLPEYRACETWLRTAKLGQPKSCWQLAYTGSVGGQTILGIPHVHHLRANNDRMRIWPFETGFEPLEAEALDGVDVIVAEIYPSIVKAKAEPGEPLDKAQVREIARHYSELDGKRALAPLFGPPDGLDTALIPKITAEEGWILAG